MKFHRDLLCSSKRKEDYNKYFTVENIHTSNITVKFSNTALLEYVRYDSDNKPIDKKWANLTKAITVNPNCKILIRKRSDASITPNTSIGKFTITGNFNLHGNIMALVYGDSGAINLDPNNHANIFSEGIFYNTATKNYLNDVVSSNFFPSKTLTDKCYYQFFKGCTNLKHFNSKLPGEASYNIGDTNYTATECYSEMFSGCTNLLFVGSIQSQSITNKCCYQMFYGCTALTSTPSMTINHAETECCKEMFANSSITSSNNITINAASNSSYEKMFNGCVSLENTPTISSNTTLYDKSCSYMFYGCTALINASNITIANIDSTGTNCCEYMFYGCSALASAPGLPATTLVDYCYYHMFQGCTSLVNAPELPAIALTSYCYSYMFRGCTGLTTAKLGTAENNKLDIGINSCEYMFYECSLLNVDSFEINSVNSFGCYGMFQKCTALTTFPKINCTSFKTQCFSSMFEECTNIVGIKFTVNSCESYSFSRMFAGCKLTTGNLSAKDVIINSTASYCCTYMFNNSDITYENLPKLNATTLKNYCYQGMFSSCKSLKKIDKTLFPAGILATGCYENMFKSCTNTGFTKLPSDLFDSITTLKSSCFCGMFSNCSYLTDIPANLLSRFNTVDSCYEYMFEYSGFTLNDTTLSTYAGFIPKTSLNVGCYYGMFKGCKNIKKITKDFLTPATKLASECYYGMFAECTNLVEMDDDLLPSIELYSNCYSYMFNNCSALTSEKTLKTLPATNLINGCYNGMFKGCTGLTKTPIIAATTISSHDGTESRYGCCGEMFKSCTNLVEATYPNITELYAYDFYQMFYRCTKLTSNPSFIINSVGPYSCAQMFYETGITDASGIQFLAAELKANCYEKMFYFCRSLTTAPSIISCNTVAYYCCHAMFSYCDSLLNAPELPGIITNTSFSYCYRNMFYDCKSLTSIPSILPSTTLSPSCYENMFFNCASLTSAPELPATKLATGCYDGMFYGCNSLISAPTLPATTLASSCYYMMFYNCKSLTTAPELPATQLTSNCYYQMFYGCTNLNTVMCRAENMKRKNAQYDTNGNLTGYTYTYPYTTYWMTGTASTGKFYISLAGWNNLNLDEAPNLANSSIPSTWAIYDIDNGTKFH